MFAQAQSIPIQPRKPALPTALAAAGNKGGWESAAASAHFLCCCLKLNIQKTKIMASGLITSWQTGGETMETVADFIFLGSKITADGDCSHERKRCLPLGRKVMTNLDSIFKRRNITLPTKVHVVKAMVFPIVMYRCESWTIKTAEWWIIDAFKLWYWRRLLRVLGLQGDKISPS